MSKYSILSVLELDFEKKHINENDEKRHMCDFRVAVIRYLVNLSISNFKDHIEEIDNGTYSKEQIEDGDYISEALHEFAIKNIYPQREIEQIELTGVSTQIRA